MGHQMIRLMHLIFNSNQFSNSLQSKNRAALNKEQQINSGLEKTQNIEKMAKREIFSFLCSFISGKD